MSRQSSWFHHDSPLEKTVRHEQRFIVYGHIKDAPVPPTSPRIEVWKITKKGAYASKWSVGVSETDTTGCPTHVLRDRGRVTYEGVARVELWFEKGRPPGVYRIQLLCTWIENGVERSLPSPEAAVVMLVDDSPESKELEEKERERERKWQEKHEPWRFKQTKGSSVAPPAKPLRR